MLCVVPSWVRAQAGNKSSDRIAKAKASNNTNDVRRRRSGLF